MFFAFIELVAILLIGVGLLSLILTAMGYYATFPGALENLKKKWHQRKINFHDNFLKGFTKRNLSAEEEQSKILYWIKRGNCLELNLLAKKPGVLDKILGHIEEKEDYFFGIQFAEYREDKELLNHFYQKQYERCLKEEDYSLAIDFAKRLQEHKIVYELTKVHGNKEDSIQLGDLAEKAGEFEEAIEYYKKDNGLYEIARLLMRQKEFDRILDYCKGISHQKIGIMVLETLKAGGYPEEADRLKEKIIAWEKENIPES